MVALRLTKVQLNKAGWGLKDCSRCRWWCAAEVSRIWKSKYASPDGRSMCWWSQLCSSCWYFDRLKFIKIERVEVHGHPFQESQLGEISTLRQHGTTMNKTGMPFAYMCSLCSRGLDLGKLPVHPSLTISYHYHGCSTHICILHYFQCMQ